MTFPIHSRIDPDDGVMVTIRKCDGTHPYVVEFRDADADAVIGVRRCATLDAALAYADTLIPAPSAQMTRFES